MRVGLDWRPTYGQRGGIPVYVRRLAAAYAERFPADELRLYGHQLRRRAAGPGTAAGPAGARLHDLRLPSRAVDALARFGVGADRLVGGCDVFHLTDYAWLRPTRAPLVATVHDVLFLELPRCYTADMRRGLLAFTRRVVRSAARIVVPSVRAKSGLVERLGADPARVDVVPHAPRDLPDVPAAREARPYLLTVGTLEPRKNHARLLDAYARLRASGVEVDLVVAGAPGWLDDDIRARLAASPGVRYEGAVSDERLGALYRGAVALAYPSLGEGFGLPVLEGLHLGVPVVTSAGTACADVAGESALLVDPYDVDALADGLARILSDRALRDDLVRRGRARAAAFTWTRTAEATRESYVRAAG